MTSDLSRGNRGAGGQPGNTTGQIKDQAQQKAAEVKDQVQQKAAEVKDQVQQQAASRLSMQKDSAAQSLTGVAQALRQTGQQLRGQDQMGVTDYIEQAADQVERLSRYLEGNDLGRLVGDVERFARRQPAIFLGGAFLAGLIGARFLRSSRPEPRYDDYTRYGDGYPGYGYRGVYGSGMGGDYSPGYGATGTTGYGTTGATGYGTTNYGTGEVPGVYRPTDAGEIDRNRPGEPRSRAYGEPLEE